MVIVDTSGLFAALDRSQNAHALTRAFLESDPGPFLLSPFVLAELDSLLVRSGALDTELKVLREVANGAYDLVAFGSEHMDAAAAVVERYRDLRIGLADASIVVLAERYRTSRLLTFDERHFRAITPLQGGSFTILPADA